MRAPPEIRPGAFALLATLLLAAGLGRPVASSGQAATPAQRVGPVVTTVRAMSEALPFYRDVLQFSVVSDFEVADPSYDRLTGVFASRVRIAVLALGPDTVELVDFITPEGRDVPRPVRSNDHWFQHLALVVRDIDAATARLRAHDVRLISPGPQRFPDGRAFLYFMDPDGHPLELAELPGEAPLRPGALFQRIDHTALVVEEMARRSGSIADSDSSCTTASRPAPTRSSA